MAQANNNPKPTILKETREAKGLTLDIVHEATKIPLDALKAIEEGYSLRMMSPFYYRGFIKMYADFLGLNVAEVQQMYGIVSSDHKSHAALKAASAAKMAQPQSNYAKEQIQEWFGVFFKRKNLVNAGKLAAALLALFVVVKIGGCAFFAIKAKVSANPHGQTLRQDKKVDPVKEMSKDKPKKVDAPLEQVQEKALKAESPDHKVSLALRALKDTSIQVKADGKVVFQMTMKKGTMESWDAENEIILSGKNINELEMEVNGKHIGALGSAERKAKKVVISKEGLTVKK